MKTKCYELMNCNYKTNVIAGEDDIKPWSIDTELYFKYLKIRNNKLDPEEYHTKDGTDITGRKLNKRPHKYHKLKLEKDNKVYVVDTVHILWYFGKYVSLTIREKNSNSHTVIAWENISCHDLTILNQIEENHIKFKQI